MHLRAGLCALLLLTAACGEPEPAAGPTPGQPPQDLDQEYEVAATVLESREHGPELCLGPILDSLPPQCGGPPVRNWDWDRVPGRESRAGTTWAGVNLRGTYDGTTFTVTALLDRLSTTPARPPQPDFSPACSSPEVLDGSVGVDAWGTTAGTGDVPELVATWMSHDPPAINVIVRPGRADTARQQIRSGYRGPLCLVERDRRTRSELQRVQARVTERLGGRFLTAATDEVRGVVVVSVIVATPQLQAELDREHGAGVVELEGRLTPVSRSRPPRAGGG